jgi:hypothetical protein
MGVVPLFLLSLPRSGSTLVQRVLTAHWQIGSSAEPWIALPLIYALKTHGGYTEYGHRSASNAISQFITEIPDGKRAYEVSVNSMLSTMYAKAAQPENRYFLDKTPRYHLIATELADIFPEARFIILWRNPLAVAASIIDTWGKGSWNLFMFYIDLYTGLENLFAAQKYSSNSLAINYERLLDGMDDAWRQIFTFLGLDYAEDLLHAFAGIRFRNLAGRGDITGQQRYQTLSKEPLTKWRKTLNNPLRLSWAKRYIRWIGEDRLTAMGYDLSQLMAELNAIVPGTRHLFGDFIRMAYGKLFCMFEIGILKDKIRRRTLNRCNS